MEVSTVSPPPISPTEGDDPCEIDVTNMAIHSVTLLISLCRVAGNGTAVWLLRKNAITIYLFKQAFDDFLLLVFAVPSSLLFLLEDISCSIIMSPVYLTFLFQLALFSYNMGLYRLAFTNVEKFRYTLYPLCCHCHFPEGLLWVVMRALKWAFFYAVIALNPILASVCQSQEQEHCRVALISMYALSFLLFAAPMVISSTILLFKAKGGSKQQQQQFKRLDIDIVIFLVVLLAFPISVCNFLKHFGYIAVSSQVFFLLACIHSTIKPYIYFLVGSWKRDCFMMSYWRECSMDKLRWSLQRLFEKPENNIPSSNDAPVKTVI